MDTYDESQPPRLSLMDLVFAGFNSRVFALDRETGRLVWHWHAPRGRSTNVAVLVDGDRLIVSVQGYMYCLDPITGQQLWENQLSGFGVGIPSLASLQGNSGSAAAAALIAQQQAAASGAT
jgi:outer membrane protein assembly factor BamB